MLETGIFPQQTDNSLEEAVAAEAEEAVAVAEEVDSAEAEAEVEEAMAVEAEAMVAVVGTEEATMYLTPTTLSGIILPMNGTSLQRNNNRLLELAGLQARRATMETTVESMLLKWQTKLLPTYNNRDNVNHYKLLACK